MTQAQRFSSLCRKSLNLYNTPANKFVAGFIGSPAMNLIEAEFEHSAQGCFIHLARARIPLGEDKCNSLEKNCNLTTLSRIWLGVRPEDIHSIHTHSDVGTYIEGTGQ